METNNEQPASTQLHTNEILSEVCKMKEEICTLLTETEAEKKKKRRGHYIGILIVIMLGATALLSAWAGWIASLHGGNKSYNFTLSNNLSAEGNALYNEGMQVKLQDILNYTRLTETGIDMRAARAAGDEAAEARNSELRLLTMDLMTPEFMRAYHWAAQLMTLEHCGLRQSMRPMSPFYNAGLMEFYFGEAWRVQAQAEEVLRDGKADGINGDAFGLVAVLYTIALFLLGISNTFISDAKKIAVFAIAMVSFCIATVYMVFLPMPDNFSFASFINRQAPAPGVTRPSEPPPARPFTFAGTWSGGIPAPVDIGYGYANYYQRHTFNSDGTGFTLYALWSDLDWRREVPFTWSRENGTLTKTLAFSHGERTYISSYDRFGCDILLQVDLYTHTVIFGGASRQPDTPVWQTLIRR